MRALSLCDAPRAKILSSLCEGNQGLLALLKAQISSSLLPRVPRFAPLGDSSAERALVRRGVERG